MYTTIRPEQFLAPNAFQAVLDRCNDPIASVRDHLDGVHGALLGLGLDLGTLPAPETIRATRDAGPIVRAMADLTTLGLLREDTDGGLIMEPAVEDCMEEALRAFWKDRADQALQQARALPQTDSPRAESRAQRWLRNLLVFLSHRGLRQTASGALHQGDLRRYEEVCELPGRADLEVFVRLGTGLGIFESLGERMIVGAQIDVLDLSGQDFMAVVHRAWGQGDVQILAAETASVSGIFATWAEVLAGDDARSAVAPDPASALIDGQSRFDLRGVDAAAASAQSRVREAIAITFEQLPAGARIPMDLLAQLLTARLALCALRDPVYVDRRRDAPPARVFAAGLTPMLWYTRRVQEALPELVRQLLTLFGGAKVEGEHITVSAPPAHRTPATALTVQPNGEVMAPPTISAHALVHLACGAKPQKLDVLSTFTIERRSLMRLCDAGMDVMEWGDLLAHWASNPLPATVTDQLRDIARRHGEFQLVPVGAILTTEDPVRMAELMSHRALAQAVLTQPSATVVVLREDTDLTELLEVLGDRGFSVLVRDDLQ